MKTFPKNCYIATFDSPRRFAITARMLETSRSLYVDGPVLEIIVGRLDPGAEVEVAGDADDAERISLEHFYSKFFREF